MAVRVLRGELHVPHRRALLTTLFVLSGAAGLSFEVLWTRLLAPSLGGTTRATTIVVAIFMAGLALGGLLGARLAVRSGSRRPAFRYGVVELAIGVSAWLVTGVLPSLERLASVPARFVVAALLLLVPSALMGATFPLVSAALPALRGRHAGLLYAANTFGAALGCLLAGFIGIGALGAGATSRIAALVDLACGVAAMLAFRSSAPSMVKSGAASVAADVEERTARAPSVWFVVVPLVSGLAALAEEILWTRALLPYVNSSTYAFAAILATYLVGLALGSAWSADRLGRTRDAISALVLVQACLAVAVALTPLAMGTVDTVLPYYAGVSGATSFGSWVSTVLATFGKTAIVVLPPTFLLGATTPLALRLAIDSGARAGRAAGLVAASGTVGGIVGAIVAGLVLVPAIGVTRGILVAAAVHLGLALALLGSPLERAAWRAPAVACALAAALLLAIAGASSPRPFLGRIVEQRGYRPLLVDEGPQDTTVVVERRVGSLRVRGILSNGAMYAGDAPPQRRYMALLGHLPVLLAADPSSALVICVGTGTTAGAVALHPEVRSLELVDISPVVHRTLPFFEHVNHRVAHDSRVRFQIADGRQFLTLPGRAYGVITLEPPPPRMAGAASLYTRDFYEHALARLAPGGVLAQWLPLHGMTAPETWMLVRTFLAVFPDGALFLLTPDEAALVGTRGPLRVDLDRVRRRLAAPRVRDELSQLGFHGEDPERALAELLAASPAHGRTLRRLAGAGPVVTSDQPLIEQFGIGLATSPNATDGRLSLLRALARTPFDALPTTGRLPVRFVEETVRTEDAIRAWSEERGRR